MKHVLAIAALSIMAISSQAQKTTRLQRTSQHFCWDLINSI